MSEPKQDQITKKDLQNVKQELLNELASKSELEQKVSKLSTREALEGDIKEIKWDMTQIRDDIKSLDMKGDEKFDIIITAIDGITKELINTRTEKAAIDHALIRQDDRLEDHDGRIRKLEIKKAS